MFICKSYKNYYYLYYKTDNNKYQKVSTGTTKKPEALKFLQDYISKSKQQTQLTNRVIYLSDFIKNELNKYIYSNFTKGTAEIYLRAFKTFLLLIGDKPLRSYSIKDVELFKEKRSNEISKTTVNIAIRTLRAGFNLALKWNFIENNPCNNVKQFLIPEREIKAFSNNELRELIKVIDRDYMRTIILIGANTGMRLSEIINLETNDIDLINETIIIRNKPTFKTKSGKMRVIPINETLKKYLKSIIETNNITNLYGNEYLIKNEQNYKFHRNSIIKIFKTYIRKAGLREILSFHSLRHYFISSLVKQGININYIAKLSGHSNLSTTQRYIHLQVNDLRKAVNSINLN